MTRWRGGWGWILVASAVFVFAAVIRLASASWNEIPHGDVLISASAAESIARDGEATLPFVMFAGEPRSDALETPLTGRPPLWPFLGAGAMRVIAYGTGVEPDGYFALRCLSVATGLAFLVCVWWACRRIFDRPTANLATAWSAISFLLIDFSGNGSLYILLATFFMTAAGLLARMESPRDAALLGLVLGAALLTHHSGVVLWATALFYPAVAIALGRPSRGRWIFGALLLALTCQIPWMLRNLRMFGDPFYQENSVYFLYKLGVPWRLMITEVGVWIEFAAVDPTNAAKRIARWTLGNGWNLLKKTLVLVPIFAFLTPFGLWRRLRDKQTALAVYGLVFAAVLFVGMNVVWPVVKFRTYVVWIPAFCAVGIHGAVGLRRPSLRNAVIVFGFAATLVSSWFIYRGVPSHTYYYDGVLTPDAYGRPGEEIYISEQEELRSVLQALDGTPPRPIYSAQIEAYRYTGFPIVQLIVPAEGEVLKKIAERYDVGYIVCRLEERRRVVEIFDAHELRRGETYVLLSLDHPRE